MPNKRQKQKSDLQVAFLFYIDLYLLGRQRENILAGVINAHFI
jgi:hypothetical protein